MRIHVLLLLPITCLIGCNYSEESNDCFAKIPDDSLSNTFTDPRDGEVYAIVKIGEDIWMAENLRYKSSEGIFVKENPVGKAEVFYDWEPACKACPEGWHLATKTDWNRLIVFLGFPEDSLTAMHKRNPDNIKKRIDIDKRIQTAAKLKKRGAWGNDYIDEHSNLGFNALPVGYAVNYNLNHKVTPRFGYTEEEIAVFQSSKFCETYWIYSSTLSQTHGINESVLYQYVFGPYSYLSVRCVKSKNCTIAVK